MTRMSYMSKPKSKISPRIAKSTLSTKAEIKCKAEKYSRKIIDALEEVKLVQEGKKSAKSFDDFLDEL